MVARKVNLVREIPLIFTASKPWRRASLFRLQAEVKAPGTGWMEWRIKPQAGGNTMLSQIVYFAPKGIAGFLYWYILYPVHRLVFAGLIKGIARRAIEHQQLSSD